MNEHLKAARRRLKFLENHQQPSKALDDWMVEIESILGNLAYHLEQPPPSSVPPHRHPNPVAMPWLVEQPAETQELDQWRTKEQQRAEGTITFQPAEMPQSGPTSPESSSASPAETTPSTPATDSMEPTSLTLGHGQALEEAVSRLLHRPPSRTTAPSSSTSAEEASRGRSASTGEDPLTDAYAYGYDQGWHDALAEQDRALSSPSPVAEQREESGFESYMGHAGFVNRQRSGAEGSEG